MELKKLDPKCKFSNRVYNYAKYRPDYPGEIIEFLNEAIRLTKKDVIADIGSGTGISSKLFLDNGNEVYGVEPNAEMRSAGEKYLAGYTNFHSIAASSEDTGLASESVDIITCGQAFHWFEPNSTKKEFLRILKPHGFIVLFSNRRRPDNTQFMHEYGELVSKYSQKEFSFSLNTDLPGFFSFRTIHEKVFYNPQVFNMERLKGDLISYSYIPNEEDPRFNAMISELELLFQKYNNKGKLVFDYETILQYCKMG